MNEIDSMVARFFQVGDPGKWKMHWLSWEKLSLFEKDGGLGFKKIKDFNKALVAKKMWRLIQMDNIVVAQILEAKYLPNTLPLYAKKHFRPS